MKNFGYSKYDLHIFYKVIINNNEGKVLHKFIQWQCWLGHVVSRFQEIDGIFKCEPREAGVRILNRKIG